MGQTVCKHPVASPLEQPPPLTPYNPSKDEEARRTIGSLRLSTGFFVIVTLYTHHTRRPLVRVHGRGVSGRK